MAEVLSYGEDGLTYWVLTRRLAELLGQLSDQSPPTECLTIYRPSFGRGGAAKAAAAGGSARSEFGEFDAILRTGEAVYLIEAKWSRSSENASGHIEIRPQQTRRHQIFRWYLEQWRSLRPSGWAKFHQGSAKSFAEAHPGFAMAPVGSLLASNLEYVLGRLSDSPARVRDVLLHIGLPGAPKPSTVSPPEFELVHIEAETVSDGGYFRLQ